MDARNNRLKPADFIINCYTDEKAFLERDWNPNKPAERNIDITDFFFLSVSEEDAKNLISGKVKEVESILRSCCDTAGSPARFSIDDDSLLLIKEVGSGKTGYSITFDGKRIGKGKSYFGSFKLKFNNQKEMEKNKSVFYMNAQNFFDKYRNSA